MTAVLFLHMLCAFVWLGCVLTETVMERAGDVSTVVRRLVSRAHWRIDLLVELPAFLGVLLTGGYMVQFISMTPLLMLKIAAGLIAVGVNVYCVLLVGRRHAAAVGGNFGLWEAIDRRQHRYGAVVLVAMLFALAIGGHLLIAGGQGT